MIALAWISGYLVAVITTNRIVLTRLYGYERRLGAYDHGLAVVCGALWPVVVAIALAYILIRYVWVPLVTPSALRRDRRAAADQSARDAALDQARRHGLPYPTRASEPLIPLHLDEDDLP